MFAEVLYINNNLDPIRLENTVAGSMGKVAIESSKFPVLAHAINPLPNNPVF